MASVVYWRRLSSSVTLPAGGPAGRVGDWAADTARRASRVTSRKGDALFYWYNHGFTYAIYGVVSQLIGRRT